MVYPEGIRKELVYTIPDRCRVCYTCVRECPAKAIRIENGQAAVMHERCIACGNCVKVCSQDAKAYLLQKDLVKSWLEDDEDIIALLAPSFVAEFVELDQPLKLVSAIRSMGFFQVCEVAFGADLVAKAYSETINDPDKKPIISSDCPAIVQYIVHFHPELIDSLAPVVSPMVAMTRVVRERYGQDKKIVFIGPCIGKKAESQEIDAGLTFTELRQLLSELHINLAETIPKDFDPPWAMKGGIFPVKRGLLQTLEISEDLFEGKMLVAEGRANFPQAIAEFEHGSIANQNMELLCCDGCIMGPGMSPHGSRFQRRAKVGAFVSQQIKSRDYHQWASEIEYCAGIDMTRAFESSDQRLKVPPEEAILQVLEEMGKHAPSDELNCGACGYESCRDHAIAIAQGLAEKDMCLPKLIEKLENTKQALKQSEKLAHMGQLSAGIAHELNNPLGVVIMYANLMLDEGPDPNIRKDIEMIVNQADRCKRIVGNLLNFARKNQIRKETTNISQLLRNTEKGLLVPEGVVLDFQYPKTSLVADLDQEQIQQVLTNLCRNGIEAMDGTGILTVQADLVGLDLIIRVRDTGSGISQENMDKLFTPFFTTKEYGKGTGLGLATSYGIVKMHKGQIEVASNVNADQGPTGTCFTICLPYHES